jgi:hypothetical protein
MFYRGKRSGEIFKICDFKILFLKNISYESTDLQNYLLFFSNFKMRQLFTKFRVSDHSLEIESGRYKNITREERICKNCNDLIFAIL